MGIKSDIAKMKRRMAFFQEMLSQGRRATVDLLHAGGIARSSPWSPDVPEELTSWLPDLFDRFPITFPWDSPKPVDPALHNVWIMDNIAFREGEKWKAEWVACYFIKNTGKDVSRAVAMVADSLDLSLDDEELQKRMAKRLQPFADQILPNRTLEITVDGKETLVLGPSNQSGYSSDSTKHQEGPPAPKSKQQPPTSRPPFGLESTTHLIEPTGWAIISDIDDTIKVTQTTSPLGILRNTFCVEEPQPVSGMPELYTHLKSALRDPAFLYLSASPYNLYPFLRTFRTTHFPSGPLILRDASWQNLGGLIASLSQGTREYKADRIEKVHSWLPQRKAILIGDSTQSDPEAYGDCARKFPEWVGAVFIRKVVDIAGMDEEAKNGEERFEKAFEGVERGIWHVFTEPSEVRVCLSGLTFVSALPMGVTYGDHRRQLDEVWPLVSDAKSLSKMLSLMALEPILSDPSPACHFESGCRCHRHLVLSHTTNADFTFTADPVRAIEVNITTPQHLELRAKSSLLATSRIRLFLNTSHRTKDFFDSTSSPTSAMGCLPPYPVWKVRADDDDSVVSVVSSLSLLHPEPERTPRRNRRVGRASDQHSVHFVYPDPNPDQNDPYAGYWNSESSLDESASPLPSLDALPIPDIRADGVVMDEEQYKMVNAQVRSSQAELTSTTNLLTRSNNLENVGRSPAGGLTPSITSNRGNYFHGDRGDVAPDFARTHSFQQYGALVSLPVSISVATTSTRSNALGGHIRMPYEGYVGGQTVKIPSAQPFSGVSASGVQSGTPHEGYVGRQNVSNTSPLSATSNAPQFYSGALVTAQPILSTTGATGTQQNQQSAHNDLPMYPNTFGPSRPQYPSALTLPMTRNIITPTERTFTFAHFSPTIRDTTTPIPQRPPPASTAGNPLSLPIGSQVHQPLPPSLRRTIAAIETLTAQSSLDHPLRSSLKNSRAFLPSEDVEAIRQHFYSGTGVMRLDSPLRNWYGDATVLPLEIWEFLCVRGERLERRGEVRERRGWSWQWWCGDDRVTGVEVAHGGIERWQRKL
ncbi:hypothetical protein Q7P37_008289 [Cladosporium fusiforme]